MARLNWKKLYRDRICIVCGTHIPPRTGVADPYNGIRFHDGECSEVIRRLQKDFSRSAQGRTVSQSEFRSRLRGRWTREDSDGSQDIVTATGPS